jgi:hypothetical protein
MKSSLYCLILTFIIYLDDKNINTLISKSYVFVLHHDIVNADKIAEKKSELLDWLREKHISGIGLIELARYNPPFIPGFIKHNELLIEVHLDA